MKAFMHALIDKRYVDADLIIDRIQKDLGEASGGAETNPQGGGLLRPGRAPLLF
jgi:hypothetical protein